MENFSAAIKILIGIAVLYFICDALLPSGKFKPYVQLILGLCVLITVIEPIYTLIKADFNIDYDIQPSEPGYDYRDDLQQTWNDYTLQKLINNVLRETYSQYTFTVRTHKDKTTYRIYLTAYDDLSAEEIYDIKKLISNETGISSDYVNIYLQNEIIEEE